jgi:hypothetical protein
LAKIINYSGWMLGTFGSLAPPSLSQLSATSLPNNLPYRFQRDRVLERAQVSDFPAFGGSQDRSTEDFARSGLRKSSDDVDRSWPRESAKVRDHDRFDLFL